MPGPLMVEEAVEQVPVFLAQVQEPIVKSRFLRVSQLGRGGENGGQGGVGWTRPRGGRRRGRAEHLARRRNGFGAALRGPHTIRQPADDIVRSYPRNESGQGDNAGDGRVGRTEAV